MNKAIFLDRDGVINKERKDYVKTIKEFQIFDDVPNAIKQLKKLGFLVIVITNQSAVNRRIITKKTLNEIHMKLQKILKENDTSIDKFYFCPHKPDENCKCRKPNPEMLIRASQECNIDMRKSFMIGDSLTDIQAAHRAGCRGILLEKNQTLVQIVNSMVDDLS